MDRFEVIAANSRQVVGQSAQTSGRVMQYRRLTSDKGVEPRVYTDWEEFTALPTAGQNTEVFDADRGAHKSAFTSRIRAADDDPSPPLTQGDQVLDPVDSSVWAVMGQGSSGPGTIAYTLTRDRPLMADQGDRKGGV